METRFLHTADWQLGKPFASVRDNGKRHRLQQERVDALQRLTRLVAEVNPAFVLVAGDLFDSPHVTKATVSAACSSIGSLKIPVLVIPGNHDHGGPGSIWEQEFFERERQQLAPNLQVLLKPEPVILDSAIIFPAPLLRRHEPGDSAAWIRHVLLDSSLPIDLPRIVLAHGTIQGFSSTQDDDETAGVVNFIDISNVPAGQIDYIALGDWHGTKQVGPNAWYSGTPEIDRFPRGASNDPGNILRVTIARGQPPEVEKISWSRFRWKEIDFHFSDDSSLELLSNQLEELIGNRGDEHLLLLTLDGALGLEAAVRLERLLESWESRLIRLKLISRVTIAPSEEEIAALTRRSEDPLIATVASELVSRCHGDSEEAMIARIALRELHSVLS